MREGRRQYFEQKEKRTTPTPPLCFSSLPLFLIFFFRVTRGGLEWNSPRALKRYPQVLIY